MNAYIEKDNHANLEVWISGISLTSRLYTLLRWFHHGRWGSSALAFVEFCIIFTNFYHFLSVESGKFTWCSKCFDRVAVNVLIKLSTWDQYLLLPMLTHMLCASWQKNVSDCIGNVSQNIRILNKLKMLFVNHFLLTVHLLHYIFCTDFLRFILYIIWL